MRIGIDISQIAYEGTGVANYLSNLVRELVKSNNQEYILFFSSLRRTLPLEFEDEMKRSNVSKMLIINKENAEGRLTLILVKEKLGF